MENVCTLQSPFARHLHFKIYDTVHSVPFEVRHDERYDAQSRAASPNVDSFAQCLLFCERISHQSNRNYSLPSFGNDKWEIRLFSLPVRRPQPFCSIPFFLFRRIGANHSSHCICWKRNIRCVLRTHAWVPFASHELDRPLLLSYCYSPFDIIWMQRLTKHSSKNWKRPFSVRGARDARWSALSCYPKMRIYDAARTGHSHRKYACAPTEATAVVRAQLIPHWVSFGKKKRTHRRRARIKLRFRTVRNCFSMVPSFRRRRHVLTHLHRIGNFVPSDSATRFPNELPSRGKWFFELWKILLVLLLIAFIASS